MQLRRAEGRWPQGRRWLLLLGLGLSGLLPGLAEAPSPAGTPPERSRPYAVLRGQNLGEGRCRGPGLGGLLSTPRAQRRPRPKSPAQLALVSMALYRRTPVDRLLLSPFESAYGKHLQYPVGHYDTYGHLRLQAPSPSITGE